MQSSKEEIEVLSIKTRPNVNFPFSIKQMEEIELNRPTTNESPKPHKHDFFTIILIKDVKGGVHVVDFNEFNLESNTVFFLSPGQVHLMLPDSPKGWVLTFTEEFSCTNGLSINFIHSLKLFEETGCEGPVIIAESDYYTIDKLLKLMQKEYDYPTQWSPDIITAYLKALLIEFARIKSLKSGDLEITTNKYVEDFQRLVNLHYKTYHKVSDYAEMLNITPNHLKDIIKEHLGKSAKELIIERITLEAKRLAHFTEKTSKEIGYELGFEDPAYFSRFFSKQTGNTFLDFRESIRKKYN